MTLDRLNRHLDMQKDLKRARETLLVLEAKAQPGAQVLTGMPHAPGVNDKVGTLAVELADARAEVDRLAAAVSADEKEIADYIETIKDMTTRTVFRLHFIRTLTWTEVAEIFGGYNTENTIRQLCYRQLRKDEEAAAEDAERRIAEAERRTHEYETGVRSSL